MSSGDRFYQLEFRNRPVFWGDVSSLLKIDGLVVAGGGAQGILLLPSSAVGGDGSAPVYKIIRPTEQEWSDFIKASDDPEILVGNPKVFQRKARYEISGLVQQKIWVADNFMCRYCLRPMGEVQLTIDHFIPLELGGPNDTSNYVSACRRCNKKKGSQDPKLWDGGRYFDEIVKYLPWRKQVKGI